MANKLDLKGLSDVELQDELAAQQGEYQRAQFEHASKGLANPLSLRDQRRDIARIQTEARNRELTNMSAEQLALRTKIRARRKK